MCNEFVYEKTGDDCKLEDSQICEIADKNIAYNEVCLYQAIFLKKRDNRPKWVKNYSKMLKF